MSAFFLSKIIKNVDKLARESKMFFLFLNLVLQNYRPAPHTHHLVLQNPWFVSQHPLFIINILTYASFVAVNNFGEIYTCGEL